MKQESGNFEKPKKYLKNTVIATMAALGVMSSELPAQAVQSTKNLVENIEQGKNHKGKENTIESHSFKVFEYYQLGQKSTEELRSEVAPMLLGYSLMMNMMSQIEASNNREKVALVKVTVADLGFSQGATYSQILKRADEMGLKVCPAEVGPGIRLQYSNQPEHDRFYVAMKPIFLDSHGDVFPNIFEVTCEKVAPQTHPSGLYLTNHTVGEDRRNGIKPEWSFKPDESFVFVQGAR